MTETYTTLAVERDGPVATIRFDDPDRHNALVLETADELVTAATTLGEDPSVRCLVLTHEGEFFCTGADLTELAGDESDAPQIRQLAGRLHEALVQMHQTPTPIVGGIDGIAAGAGFGLALAPDIVLVSDRSRLEFAYHRIGLTGDAGVTFQLPRLIGTRAAKELVLHDDPISPEDAVDLGLASEVVPEADFDERLREFASDVATGPTAAIATTFRLLTESCDRGLEAQLGAETDAMAGAIHSTDYRRGHEAFFSDAEPEFTGQ